MLRFTSALQVQAIPDEQLDDRFEVIMPTLKISSYATAEQANNTTKSNAWKELGNSLLSSITGGLAGEVTYQPIVEEIVFGTMNFKTDTRRVRTGWYNVPTDIENYKEASITMFCSAGMMTQYYLETWKRLVFNPYGEYYNPGNIYKKNIEVYFEGLGSAPSVDLIGGGDTIQHSMHISLVGCFPSIQDPYKLSYSADPKRIRITQKFKVDKVVFDMDKITTAKLTETLGTGGSAILDDVASALTATAANTYDIQEVYNGKASQNIF